MEKRWRHRVTQSMEWCQWERILSIDWIASRSICYYLRCLTMTLGTVSSNIVLVLSISSVILMIYGSMHGDCGMLIYSAIRTHHISQCKREKEVGRNIIQFPSDAYNGECKTSLQILFDIRKLCMPFHWSWVDMFQHYPEIPPPRPQPPSSASQLLRDGPHHCFDVNPINITGWPLQCAHIQM